MKVEIVITDHISTMSGTPAKLVNYSRELARIVLPASRDEVAGDLIFFAENHFEMSMATQPASNYHAGLRMMFLGICAANAINGKLKIVARVIE